MKEEGRAMKINIAMITMYTAAAEIVETHVLYHCVAFVHEFSFLECYMSYHMYHGVKTFVILKIHHPQPILLLF